MTVDQLESLIRKGHRKGPFPLFKRTMACSSTYLGELESQGFHGGAYSQTYKVIFMEGAYSYMEAVHADGTRLDQTTNLLQELS